MKKKGDWGQTWKQEQKPEGEEEEEGGSDDASAGVEMIGFRFSLMARASA
jgi:hypothetical protein